MYISEKKYIVLKNGDITGFSLFLHFESRVAPFALNFDRMILVNRNLWPRNLESLTTAKTYFYPGRGARDKGVGERVTLFATPSAYISDRLCSNRDVWQSL